MSKTITWLHISDMHAGKPGMDWDVKRVIETLVDDLKVMERDHGLHPDLIFFTGDAAFGQIGKDLGETLADQFIRAEEFFEAVRGAFSPKIQHSQFYIVPGNHDVNREVVTPDQIEWLDNREDGFNICSILEKDGHHWKHFMERLKEYRTFLESNHYSHLLGDPAHLIYSEVHEFEGFKVGIGGFNSV